MSVTLHTSLGDLKVELAAKLVPRLAKNFLTLCASSKYVGTRFHRNLGGFTIQGGDWTHTGKGGTTVTGELIDEEYHPSLQHSARGTISMACKKVKGSTKTVGSQFFITYDKQVNLDGNQCVIGKVVSGFDTLLLMEKAPVNDDYEPITPIVIEKISIHANPVAILEYFEESD